MWRSVLIALITISLLKENVFFLKTVKMVMNLIKPSINALLFAKISKHSSMSLLENVILKLIALLNGFMIWRMIFALNVVLDAIVVLILFHVIYVKQNIN
jgi:hypothetical protein